MTTSLKFVSPQAKSVYDLLSRNSPLTAKEIGDLLGILPNTVYRANEQLLELGVIEKSDSYPLTFTTVPFSPAMGWFLLSAQRSFKDTFMPTNEAALANQNPARPAVSFMQTRQNLLNKTDRDVARTKKEINFIVSGLEVPDSTILAYRRAVIQGVRIRALLQKRNDTSRKRLEKWSDIGVEFRYTDDLGIRMFVFDSRIVYLTSYTQSKKQEAFGVRFNYAPLAVLMNDLFEQKWQSAEIS